MTDRVTRYAKRVAAGKVVCGELHRLACKRHLEDLKRQDTDDFPYIWNVEASNDVIGFAESLTVIEGYEERAVRLLDCQAFDIGCTFGWERRDGFRRFRRRYKSQGRQQGKTFENGILGTYIGGFGGYRHGKLFTVATKKRQARLAWEAMQNFITADADLAEWFEVKDYKSLIVAKNTGCTIEALSREGGLDDGFRAIFCSVDEIHQHRDNKIYKALWNGTRALAETLISMITTRGFNLNSFAKEMDDYAVNILTGAVHAEDFFVDIYCIDANDDPFDPSVWVKANPYSIADEERAKAIAADAQTARDMGGEELRDFLTKCMNVWCEDVDRQFIERERWKDCACGLTLDDFRGERCWVGLDLSSGGDLTTVALEFEIEESGETYAYSHSFMPRGRLMEHVKTDTAPYDMWEQQGLVTVTGGEGDYKNDYKFIARHLKELRDEYGLSFEAVGYDNHNADGFLSDLEELGCPLLEVRQSAKNLNDATMDVKLLVKGAKYRYDRSNELMSWSFANAKLVYNSFGECKVDKNYGPTKRIDPVDACIDAHYARMKLADEADVDAEQAMTDYLAEMGW